MLGSVPSTPPPFSSSLATSLPPFSTTSTPRLQALYSDFCRQKHANPTSYHSNVEWWRKALEALVSSGMQQQQQTHLNSLDDDKFTSDHLVLHAGRELMERVKIPKVGKPLALAAVLTDADLPTCPSKSELRSTKSALLLPEFLGAKASIYDPGWLPARIAAYVVGKPLWWALEQMGVVGEDGLLSSMPGLGAGGGSREHHHRYTGWWGDYVLVALVERAADAVVERQKAVMASAGDALYTVESFRAAFAGVAGGEGEELRETDAKVLLRYLERDRRVVVIDKDVIKFVDQSASLDERTITAVDRGILELKSAIRNLHIQVDSLHDKIDECTKKASAALQQKRKPAALSYIRSRKHVEELLLKRLGSLSTLEATFITVEAAAGDVEIMKSYESSTVTLRAILAHPSLQRESIDKTMEALAEANADAKEVDDAVHIGGDIAVGVEDAIDDAELEEELKAMVREAEAEEKAKATDETARKLAEVAKAPSGIPVNELTTPEETVAKPIAAT